MDVPETVEYWTTFQRTVWHIGRRTPRRVRVFVEAALARRVDADTAYKAVTIVNELIINVAQHARRARTVVRVNVSADRVAVTVVDYGPGWIRWSAEMPDGDAESGRGLPMVALLADRVQLYDVQPRGKALTALIDR